MNKLKKEQVGIIERFDLIIKLLSIIFIMEFKSFMIEFMKMLKAMLIGYGGQKTKHAENVGDYFGEVMVCENGDLIPYPKDGNI